ncbi:hypothetical protein ACFU5B_26085, partial [Streptomyces murinus]
MTRKTRIRLARAVAGAVVAAGASLCVAGVASADPVPNPDPTCDIAVDPTCPIDGGNGGDPSTTGGDPSTTGGDPSTTGGDPSTTGGDPSTTGGDPSTTGGDPSTTGGDPSTTGGDPSTTGGDP